MIEYKKAQFADLVADAKTNGRVEDLKEIGLAKVKDKDGGKRKRTYLEIKKIYFSRYYPDMMPKAKEKAKTIYDILEEL